MTLQPLQSEFPNVSIIFINQFCYMSEGCNILGPHQPRAHRQRDERSRLFVWGHIVWGHISMASSHLQFVICTYGKHSLEKLQQCMDPKEENKLREKTRKTHRGSAQSTEEQSVHKQKKLSQAHVLTSFSNSSLLECSPSIAEAGVRFMYMSFYFQDALVEDGGDFGQVSP